MGTQATSRSQDLDPHGRPRRALGTQGARSARDKIHAMRKCSARSMAPTRVGRYQSIAGQRPALPADPHQPWMSRRRYAKEKRRPGGRRSALNSAQSSMARLYLAGALSFIIASRAALNGLPAYQFGQRSPPASSLPTPYISCRSSTVPSSFQVAASNSSFGPW